MLNIAKLFGKSPFAPLQTHMGRVGSCVEKLSHIFEVLPNAEMKQLETLAAELSKLEHEADLTKNDIRNHLPKSLFLPIDRSHFLEILAIQDTIADKAEHIAILLTFKPLDDFSQFKTDIIAFYKKNAEVFWHAKKIIEEIDELLESSFGGIEAEKVKTMVEKTSYKEFEVSRMQQQLMKKLYTLGTSLSPPSFSLWTTLMDEIRAISALAEKLANRIRMVLELK